MLVTDPSLPPAPQGRKSLPDVFGLCKKHSKNIPQVPWMVVVMEGNVGGNWEQRGVEKVIFYSQLIQCLSTYLSTAV